MQMKTKRYHLTPTRMAIFEKTTLTCVGENATLILWWWECKMMQQLWKIVWQFLKQLQLPCDPAIPRLIIYPRKSKTHVHTKTCKWVVIALLLILAKKVETTEMSINWRMDKQNMAYLYSGILFSHKKEVSWYMHNMHETWKHYAQWRHKRPHIVWFHLYEMSRIGKSEETESRLVAAKCGWRGTGVAANGYKGFPSGCSKRSLN